MPDADPVFAILIHEDGIYPVDRVTIEMFDGGYASLTEHLEGEPDELGWPSHRTDVVAFVREDAARTDQPRNNRATRLLQALLPVGGWVSGPALVCGQNDDGGLGELPADITVQLIASATQEVSNA